MLMEGTAACSLNAANEIAVEAFLNEKISFLEILEVNEKVLRQINNQKDPSLSDYIDADKEAREFAKNLCKIN